MRSFRPNLRYWELVLTNEKEWEKKSTQREKVEEMYQLVDEIKTSYTGMFYQLVDQAKTLKATGEKKQLSSEKLPFARLSMLIGIYSPDLTQLDEGLRKAQSSFGDSILDMMRTQGSDDAIRALMDSRDLMDETCSKVKKVLVEHANSLF